MAEGREVALVTDRAVRSIGNDEDVRGRSDEVDELGDENKLGMGLKCRELGEGWKLEEGGLATWADTCS